MPRSPATSQAGGGGAGGRNADGRVAQPLDGGQKPPEEPQPTEEEDDDDDEDRVLEVWNKWQKLNQQVTRDVPGIDAAYLAMDTEEGVEVVWNEVLYSHRRMVKGRRERLIKILTGLTQVKHQNIVNFYDFWHDKVNQQDRLVFITEYITSGSLLTFLMKTKTTKGSNAVSDKIWRRWCRHILMALSYLHKNDIIHGNLSLASIFIQHNGLVKIGSVSPDAIHQHVKTKNEETMGMHYAAPEIAEGPIKTPADIYAFGMCALEMLNFELLGNGEGAHGYTSPKQEAVLRAVEGLDERKREFIQLCLHQQPSKRPRAQDLLKHLVLQQVYPLKLLATYALRDSKDIETHKDKLDYSDNPNLVLAHIPMRQGDIVRKAGDMTRIDIEKLYEDISQDFLLDSSMQLYSPQKKDDSARTSLPQSSSSAADRNSTTYETETRRVCRMDCEVRPSAEGDKLELVLKLHLDSKMERELKREVNEDDTGAELASDLVHNGLLAIEDQDKIAEKIAEKLEHTPRLPLSTQSSITVP